MGLLDSLLAPVQYVGESLDKLGGRPLRGLLGGHPRELLSVLPFSDRYGATDPNDIVTGRDLTNQWGLTSPEDNGFGAGALGFGADVLLDPWTILGGAGLVKKGLQAGGLLGKGAKAAAAAGEAVAAPLAGMADEGGDLARALTAHTPETPPFRSSDFDLASPIASETVVPKTAAPATPSLSDLSGEAAAPVVDAGILGRETYGLPAWAGGMPEPMLPWAVNDPMRDLAFKIGPRYGGELGKLEALRDASRRHRGGGSRADSTISMLLEPQNRALAEAIANEIPPNLNYLGAGAESIAGLIPGETPSVLRISNPLSRQYGGYAEIPEMIPSYRSAVFGDLPNVPGIPQGGRKFAVNQTPLVNPAYREFGRLSWGPDTSQSDLFDALVKGHRNTVEDYGDTFLRHMWKEYPQLNTHDVHSGNVALTPEGQAIIHDLGSVGSWESTAPLPWRSDYAPVSPQKIRLFENQGGPEAMRQYLEEAVARGTGGLGVDPALMDLDVARFQARNKLIDHLLQGPITPEILDEAIRNPVLENLLTYPANLDLLSRGSPSVRSPYAPGFVVPAPAPAAAAGPLTPPTWMSPYEKGLAAELAGGGPPVPIPTGPSGVGSMILSPLQFGARYAAGLPLPLKLGAYGAGQLAREYANQ